MNAASSFTSVIDDIRKGYKDKIHPELFSVYQKNYFKALSMFGNQKHGDPYFEMVNQFKANLTRFAAHKAYHVTRQLKSIKTKDLDQFNKQAKGCIKKFNRYQAAEHHAIVARSRTAKQFEQFKQELDIYPNLEWLATKSAIPRELHKKYVGTILPHDDPFWVENQPGNLYGCKCDWRTTNKPITASPGNVVKAAEGLEGNPALTGEIFTENHPYFNVKNTDDINRFLRKPMDELLKPVIKQVVSSVDAYKGIELVNESLVTGKTVLLRKSINETYSHNLDYKVRLYSINIANKIDDWEYLGYAYTASGKHTEAKLFLYYETNIGEKKRFVNVELHDSYGEVIYSIFDSIDMKRIKRGIPKELKK
jgi:hypothetical protein